MAVIIMVGTMAEAGGSGEIAPIQDCIRKCAEKCKGQVGTCLPDCYAECLPPKSLFHMVCHSCILFSFFLQNF